MDPLVGIEDVKRVISFLGKKVIFLDVFELEVGSDICIKSSGEMVFGVLEEL